MRVLLKIQVSLFVMIQTDKIMGNKESHMDKALFLLILKLLKIHVNLKMLLQSIFVAMKVMFIEKMFLVVIFLKIQVVFLEHV